jgi:citrate lyase gamma subunit
MVVGKVKLPVVDILLALGVNLQKVIRPEEKQDLAISLSCKVEKEIGIEEINLCPEVLKKVLLLMTI